MSDSSADPVPPARPARPHQQLTADGRRRNEVLSYARRGSRFTPTEQEAWDAHHEAWYVPDEEVDRPDVDVHDWFGREAPLIVEIGSGVGEATAALAAARPDHDVLGLEVWLPGIAQTLGRVADVGATNVRMCGVDAAWSVEHLFASAGIAEVWTFFPDPWHKTRHHKRRLVGPGFATVVADRLVDGGLWRLATDWGAYAEQMVAVLDAEPRLVGGVTPRWEDRPVTKFERKGVAAGRSITDLTYRSVPSAVLDDR